ncbi:hypothetical protein, partial [Staphylococcus felis]|uniref:hypothetical protein n=1 Tax=Staphylococcus felis TaxID=46127 RepID=UPI000E36F355
MVEGQPIEAIPVTTTEDSGEKPTVKVYVLPTSDADNDDTGVELGGRRITKNKDDDTNKDVEEEQEYRKTVTSKDEHASTTKDIYALTEHIDTCQSGIPNETAAYDNEEDV